MAITPFQIQFEIGAETLTIQVEPDARLRRYARWQMRGNVVHIRVPRSTSRAEVDELLSSIVPKITKQRSRAKRRTDDDLAARAAALNRAYFDESLSWHSIRWVSNMKHRLGSFTTGGPTDGDIRISDRMRGWPEYVLDYVIAHELCHRQFPNHSPEFWAYLSRYPLTEKARGFLDGLAFAEGADT